MSDIASGRLGHFAFPSLRDRLMSIALARRYRPRRFADLLVQDHVASALRGAVVGEDDERFGERPVAFVVPERGVDTSDPAFMAALQAHCEATLGKFKRPAVFHLLAELPRSPTGKLLRRKLREHLTP